MKETKKEVEMDKNDTQIIESLKQKIEDLERELEIEREENRRLRSQLAESSGQMKPPVKRALAARPRCSSTGSGWAAALGVAFTASGSVAAARACGDGNYHCHEGPTVFKRRMRGERSK
jgi:hypothetical protein